MLGEVQSPHREDLQHAARAVQVRHWWVGREGQFRPVCGYTRGLRCSPGHVLAVEWRGGGWLAVLVYFASQVFYNFLISFNLVNSTL